MLTCLHRVLLVFFFVSFCFEAVWRFCMELRMNLDIVRNTETK